jgi:hypothetical protein
MATPLVNANPTPYWGKPWVPIIEAIAMVGLTGAFIVFIVYAYKRKRKPTIKKTSLG